MNDEDEKIEVAVDEAPEDGVEVEASGSAPAKTGNVDQQENRQVDPEEAIAALKNQLENERRAREEAEHMARRAAEQANAAYVEVEDTNIQLVNTAIDTVKRENELLTSNYAEAMSMQDYERAAKIQATMASNSAKLLQLENGLREMHNAPRRPVAPVAPSASAQLDQIINAVSPRSATWLRNNKTHINDDRMIKKMFRAHEDAIDDGVEPDSDAYFSYIENRLGINSAKAAETPMSAAAKPVRQAPPPSAPVNRESSSRSNTVRLTRAEAETAKMLGMTETEYAKHKIALQKEGKLPH